MSNFAWVTLTTNDAYSLGALVLAHSLKRVGTAHQLAVLVTPTVSEAMRIRLREVYNLVQEVNVLDSQDAANLALLARPELGVTFTKLHAWRLVQYEKCVFLDSDILVLKNADELFEREELSAAPDVSWPDCFNSGVFVYRPNETTFASLIEFALENGSFDGGDQGVLNSYFSEWAHKDISKHLPFTYNTTAFATYSYLPAFKQFRDKIKILHFAGKLKPWLLNFNSETKTAYIPSEFQHAADLIQMWWSIFCDNVHQNLSDQMQNYWPKMELRNVPIRTDNRHTSDSCPSNNKPNYDMGNFFDDIQPYRDPWEDYYEKLENLIEQNSSNNNVTSDNQTQSPPPATTTTTPLPPQFEPTVEQNSNTNITPEYVPPVEPTPPPVASPKLELNQFSTLIEDLYNDNVTKESATNFIENIVQSFDQQLIAINRTMDQHKLQTSDTNQTPPRKGSSSTTTPVSSERDSSAETESSNKDSNSISNLSLKSSDDEGKLVVEKLQFDKKLDTNEAGLAGALAKVRLGEPRTTEQEAYEESMRRQCWESGNIDYSGKDSFDNIWKKISQTLDSKPAKPSGSN